MSMQEIAINGWNLVKTDELEGHWLTGEEIGTHLGYADPRVAVNLIFNRHQDNFKTGLDCSDIKLISEAGVRNMRIFSERGTLKVIRYSNTDVADKIIDEVFDVYLAVRKLSTSGKSSRELPEMKAADLAIKFMKTAKAMGVTRAQARGEMTEEVKRLTGVDFAAIFKFESKPDVVEMDSTQEKENFARLLEAWYQCLGGKPVTLKKARSYLVSDKPVASSKVKVCLISGCPDKAVVLREAIAEINLNGELNFKTFGYYLRKNKNCIGGGYELIGSKKNHEGVKWQVCKLVEKE